MIPPPTLSLIRMCGFFSGALVCLGLGACATPPRQEAAVVPEGVAGVAIDPPPEARPGPSPTPRTTPEAAPPAAPEPGVPSLLSTTDGTVDLRGGIPTLVSVVRQQDAAVAKQAGASITDADFANRRIQVVTVLDFANALPSAFRKLTLTKIDQDLAEEGERLRPLYAALGVTRDPREDLHVVPDFDGSVAQSLGSTGGAPRIVLIDGRGRIVRAWNQAPTAAEIEQALATQS